jgi:hypothetical protein
VIKLFLGWHFGDFWTGICDQIISGAEFAIKSENFEMFKPKFAIKSENL